MNEVGAGGQQPIEFQGQRLPVKNSVKYTKITRSRYEYDPNEEDYRLGYYGKQVATEEDYPFELIDNEANITIGYYLNTCDHPEYISQPRRFVQAVYTDGSTATGTDNHPGNWTGMPVDISGITFRPPIDEANYCTADWKLLAKSYTGGSHQFPTGGIDEYTFTQKLDNLRYTLFVRDLADWGSEVGLFPSYYQDLWSGSTYYRYRELKTLSVDSGFNTPGEIAAQLTSQLQKTNPLETFQVWDNEKHAGARKQILRDITATVDRRVGFIRSKSTRHRI